MTGCCADGCTNRHSKGFLMKRFPRDPVRRKIWAAKVRRENWTPTNTSYLCEVHFAPDMFEQNRADGKKMLKPNAIPTIFPHIPPKKAQKPPTKRSSPRKILSTTTVSVESIETPELNDVTTANIMIKEEVASNDDLFDSENTEYITDDVTQIVTEAYHNKDEVRESASSTILKCEPLMEMNNSPLSPTKNGKESYSLETLNQSVTKLHELTMMRSSEVVKDEYYYFAMHIASQLRKLPTRNFIILQERIQSLVSEERLKVLVPPDQTASTASAPGCP